MDLNDGNGGGAGSGNADDLLGGGSGAGAGGEGGQGGTPGDGGAGSQTDPGAGGADPDWYQQLSADADGDEPSARDWVKSIGAKDINGLAKIARDNQRALRESGRIKVPGEGATAEELAAFNKAIGVPEDPSGYKLPELKDADGNPVELNTDKLNAITAAAHKHGIPARALEGVLQDIAQADAQELAAAESKLVQQAQEHANSWGDKKDSKLAAINAAARELGLSREELMNLRAALGPARALDLMADLGSRLSEDTLVSARGDVRRFGISGSEAKAQLQAKMNDAAWASKVRVPGSAERAEYERLNDAIAAAADREAAAA